MASNHGIPPPPPPAHPSGGQDAGSIYPPPPPQPHPHAQYYSHQHQPHQMSSMQNPAFLQQPQQHQYPQYQQYQQYQTGQPSYQNGFYQQQQHQQMYQQQYQYSHPQYANNYGVPPPPPPPPPSQSNNWQHKNHRFTNNANQGKGRKGQSKHSNADAAASLRQSLTSNSSPEKESNTNKPSNKKINPKMAKKYAGRGLKTITICGPGMPTQKFKICVGNHPEDVKKWIEERRKRFPRVGGPQKESAKGAGQHSSGTKRDREEDGNNVENKRVCANDNETSKEGEEAGGLSSLLAGYDSSSSDEDGEITTQETKPAGKGENVTPAVGTSLEIDNTNPSTTLPGTSNNNNNPQPKRICKFYRRSGRCRNGTSCKFLHTDATPEEQSRQRQSQSDRDKARNQYQRELQILGLATPSHGSRYTSGDKVINNTSLLHKLLQRDKERERRLTLQLLRYIVDSNYFQGDGRNDDEEASKSKSEEAQEENKAAK